MYFDCWRRGVTLRSGVDCLIAQCAMESELTLLHHDRDSVRMATVVADLSERNFLA